MESVVGGLAGVVFSYARDRRSCRPLFVIRGCKREGFGGANEVEEPTWKESCKGKGSELRWLTYAQASTGGCHTVLMGNDGSAAA